MHQGEKLKIPYEGMRAIKDIQQDIKNVKQTDLNTFQVCNENIDALTEELCLSCKDKMYKDPKFNQYVTLIVDSVKNSQLYKNELEFILSKVKDFLESLISANQEQQEYYASSEFSDRGFSIQDEQTYKTTIDQYLDSVFLKSLENKEQIRIEQQEKFDREKQQFIQKMCDEKKKEDQKVKIYIIQLQMLLKSKKLVQEKYLEEIQQLKDKILDLQYQHFNHNSKIIQNPDSRVDELKSELEEFKNLCYQEKENMKQEISKLQSTLQSQLNAIKKFFKNHIKDFQ